MKTQLYTYIMSPKLQIWGHLIRIIFTARGISCFEPEVLGVALHGWDLKTGVNNKSNHVAKSRKVSHRNFLYHASFVIGIYYVSWQCQLKLFELAIRIFLGKLCDFVQEGADILAQIHVHNTSGC